LLQDLTGTLGDIVRFETSRRALFRARLIRRRTSCGHIADGAEHADPHEEFCSKTRLQTNHVFQSAALVEAI
jgi:hypothetical protein